MQQVERLEGEAGPDQRAPRIDDRRNTETRALLECAAATNRPVSALATDIVNHARRQLALDETGDADGVLRVAVKKIRRPVQGIDDPDQLAADPPLGRELLAHDHRVGLGPGDLFGDHPFGGAVHLGHEIVLRFLRPGVDGRPGRSAHIIGGAQRRALRQLD